MVRKGADSLLGGPPVGAALGDLAWPLLIAGIIGLIAWAASWGIAGRAARPLTIAGGVERGSSARKAYLYLGQLAALAAVVIQAGLALRDLFLSASGRGLMEPVTGGDALVAQAAGIIVALLFWGYLRWETVRDGDFGREPGRAANWRRAYVYLAAMSGSVLAVGGAGELLRTLLTALNGGPGSAPWQARAAAALAALVVGALLALLAWGRANALASYAPAIENNALSRVALRYAGLFFGTVVTLITLGYLLDGILRFVLRQPFGPYWPAAMAYLPAGVITWLACAGGIQRDVAAGSERGRTGAIRRSVRYILAALALAAFWFGLAESVRLILLGAVGVAPADPAVAATWWERFTRATALILIGAPAWWGHWWSLQVRAGSAGPAGRAERASAVRRVYLIAVALAGACIGLAALGFGAFLALNWQSVGATGVRAVGATAGAAASVSLIWAAAHFLMVRGDGRWLIADGKGQAAAGGNP